MREWRELSAGRLLAIRREVLRETEDALERDLLCNAAVLAESLTEDGERVYPDGEAVLGALSCREMEELLRELLEGAPGDTFGIAGYCVPPMYRQGLADAMEKMCASRARREEMGQIGQRRVDAYFHHEQMLANYQKMYDETATEYHLE